MFLKIFSAPDAPIGGFPVLIGHQKQQSRPHFRSTHLTISTLVSCQETNGIVTVGPHTYRFGGKYPDDVWVEKKK
jgi:hypothetical protein